MRVSYSSLLGFQIQFPEYELSEADLKSLLFALVQQASTSTLKQLRKDLDRLIPALEIADNQNS